MNQASGSSRTRAPFAADPAHSRGRLHPEDESRTRTPFARDRDRIIHATAFRRLKEKSQVFVAHEGDYYRTRLTHSLEVAQIARSLARVLGLDDDLAEAIALAHDMGHPPFGHAGEDELRLRMEPFGSFDHNVQTFRVVTQLEVRYPTFVGLNLAWETLEGVVKHNGPVAHRLNEPAWAAIASYNQRHDLQLSSYASAEAQTGAIADDIAYNNHDVDDGLRSGLVTLDQLKGVAIFARHIKAVQREHPKIDARRLVHETVRRMIGTLVTDLTRESAKNIQAQRLLTIDDVRAAPALIAFSAPVRREQQELKHFLRVNLYQHHQVARMTNKARRVVHDLFQAFIAEPQLMPPQYHAPAAGDTARTVADYIAGMTDRYAIREYRRLFAVDEI